MRTGPAVARGQAHRQTREGPHEQAASHRASMIARTGRTRPVRAERAGASRRGRAAGGEEAAIDETWPALRFRPA
jgi:hypothetical protein